LDDGNDLQGEDWVVRYDSGENAASWKFPSLLGASLPDGNYRATLSGAGISDAAGNLLIPAGDAEPGEDLIFELFRYYGDINGDRDVDFLDQFGFALAYRKQAGDDAFVDFLDYNGDGVVDEVDRAAYATNYLSVLAPAESEEGNAVPDSPSNEARRKQVEVRRSPRSLAKPLAEASRPSPDHRAGSAFKVIAPLVSYLGDAQTAILTVILPTPNWAKTVNAWMGATGDMTNDFEPAELSLIHANPRLANFTR